MKLDNLFLRVGTGLFLAAQLTACGDNTDDKKAPDTTDDDTDTDTDTDTDQGLSWELTKLTATQDEFEADDTFPFSGEFKLKEGKTDEPKVDDEIDVFVTLKGVKINTTGVAGNLDPVAVKAKVTAVEADKKKVTLAITAEKLWGANVCNLAEKVSLMEIWLAATPNATPNDEIHSIDSGTGAPVPQSYKHPLLESATLDDDSNDFEGTFSYTGELEEAAFNALNLYGIITLTISQTGGATGTGTVTLTDGLDLVLNDSTNTQVDFVITKAQAKAKVDDVTVISGTLAAANTDISITGISLDVFTDADVKIATVTNGTVAIGAGNSFVLETDNA